MQCKNPTLAGLKNKPVAMSRAAFCRVALLSLLLPHGICKAQEAQPAPEKKEEGTMARILCVQSLSGKEQDVILATKTEEGEWKEYGEITLRSPFIGDWMRVPKGVSHVVTKKGEEMASLGSFTIGEGMKRAILIMLPDTKKGEYRIQVVDPTKLEFQKGKALIVNYSNLPAVVQMGKLAKTVAPGNQVVQNIDANADGMYRMLIGHVDKDKKIVACYDRFVSSNPNTRKFVLLFPDQDTGIRAMSLSEFGPFE